MIISQLSQFYTVNNNLKGIYLYCTPFSAIDTILILHRFYICYEITSYITLVSASPERGGSAELCEAKEARVRSQIKIFKSCNLCPDSSLSGNFIYSITIKLPFYDHSRMTGRYLIPLCKKSIFPFLFQLAPSDG